MEKIPLLIIGSSGHAKVVIDIVEKQNKYHIIGLIDTYKDIGEEVLGYQVVGKDEDLLNLSKEYEKLHLFVAIGDNFTRNKIVVKIAEMGISLPYGILIHPSSQIGKGVKIGKGVAIMAASVINPATTVGDFSIINTKSTVDHDCNIGEYTSIAPGATLGGGVSVGQFGVVSIGASIKHGVSIGYNTIIGAGAVLLSDVGANEVHIGVPAKFFKKRSIGDKYL